VHPKAQSQEDQEKKYKFKKRYVKEYWGSSEVARKRKCQLININFTLKNVTNNAQFYNPTLSNYDLMWLICKQVCSFGLIEESITKIPMTPLKKTSNLVMVDY
jgi:hypothetical protein